ncbi:hypothetical protein LZ30DRAFT_704979 [Colletotrichum cereale]|nr:hypothetical protein LZ30DRAFT_704979 [Colletotrichum cereale]
MDGWMDERYELVWYGIHPWQSVQSNITGTKSNATRPRPGTLADTVSKTRHVYRAAFLTEHALVRLLLPDVHLPSRRFSSDFQNPCSKLPTVASPASDGLRSGTWSLNRAMHQPRPGRLEPLWNPSTGAGTAPRQYLYLPTLPIHSTLINSVTKKPGDRETQRQDRVGERGRASTRAVEEGGEYSNCSVCTRTVLYCTLLGPPQRPSRSIFILSIQSMLLTPVGGLGGQDRL